SLLQHREKFFELFPSSAVKHRPYATIEAFWMAIFELYRHGPNEYCITSSNVTAEEAQIICNGFELINLHNRYTSTPLTDLRDSKYIREIVSAQTTFRIEICPEIR
ncbi:hypothetical protein PFISCL1PPCAC_9064, partial [Pristionchus fissidentatus]